MKQIVACIVIIFNLPLAAQTLKYDPPRLYLIDTSGVQLVKMLPPYSDLRGYDIVDSSNVMLAYQNPHYGDAVTDVAVFNIRTGKEIRVTEGLGGTGGHYFSYNKLNGFIVFTDNEGISVIQVKDSMGNVIHDSEPRKLTDFDFHGNWDAFWLDENRIIYFVESREGIDDVNVIPFHK